MSETAPQCPTCRYNLTGLPEPRCPECGRRFTPAEWADKTVLCPAPAWERRAYVSAVYAFPATILAFTFRPRRFLRSLRLDRGLLGAILFAVLLIPLACVLSVALCFLAGHLLDLLKAWVPARIPFIDFLVWKQTWKQVVQMLVRAGVRSAAFILGVSLAWLPALVALDLLFWRQRAVFRLSAKALLYSMVWSFWAVVIMSGVGNAALMQIENDWRWGSLGGWSHAGAWPWVCWLAAAVVTLQYATLLWFVRSPRCAVRDDHAPPRRRMPAVLTLGWLAALYLMLFDRHVQLRFHLQFVIEEFGEFFHWLYRWAES